MKLLANPILVRMAAVLITAVGAFVAGIIAFRILRRRIVEDEIFADSLETESSPFAYSAVIQQLKQQKFQLQHEQQEQQRRSKISEHIAASVIASMPCGLLFLSPNGLVRQANTAARKILGFASPLSMSVEEVFRESRSITESGAWVSAAAVLKDAIQGKMPSTELEFAYNTPAGDSRYLNLTLISLHTPSGESVGIAVAVADESAAAQQRGANLIRSETSAEMALELHTSLSTIREYANAIAGTDDREFAKNLANDISAEAERLGKAVGGFLAGDGEKKARAARA